MVLVSPYISMIYIKETRRRGRARHASLCSSRRVGFLGRNRIESHLQEKVPERRFAVSVESRKTGGLDHTRHFRDTVGAPSHFFSGLESSCGLLPRAGSGSGRELL